MCWVCLVQVLWATVNDITGARYHGQVIQVNRYIVNNQLSYTSHQPRLVCGKCYVLMTPYGDKYDIYHVAFINTYLSSNCLWYTVMCSLMWRPVDSHHLMSGMQYHYSCNRLIHVLSYDSVTPDLVTMTLCHIPSDTIVFNETITAPTPRSNLPQRELNFLACKSTLTLIPVSVLLHQVKWS